MNTEVKFQPIDKNLAYELLDFATHGKIGQSLTIDNVTYKLDHISIGTSQFWRSRSASVYYRTGRSVIRISDHWSANPSRPRSRKANCGEIGGKWEWSEDGSDQFWKSGATWTIDTSESLEWSRYTRKYPWVMHAGKAGLSVLNRSVSHWKEKAA